MIFPQSFSKIRMANLIVNSNVTLYNSQINMLAGKTLTVKSGYTLKLTGEYGISCISGGSIIVENGASLIMDGYNHTALIEQRDEDKITIQIGGQLKCIKNSKIIKVINPKRYK